MGPPTIIRSYTINDIQTEFIIQRFYERTFIGISQLQGKIGTYISSSVEYSIIDNSITYHISTLLGSNQDSLLEVYARQISERIYEEQQQQGTECNKPLLIGITIDRKKCNDIGGSSSMFKEIVQIVKNLYNECMTL